jgi:hypothetical protein
MVLMIRIEFEFALHFVATSFKLTAFCSTIPRLWAARSYPSVKPLGPYISDLSQRLAMFASWIDDGAPVSAWLPGFFFTQSFLTAVLQNFARKYRLPVDSLTFSYKVLVDVPSGKPENGCYIHGLYLDGGRWNVGHQCLSDPQPKVIPVTHSSPAVFAVHPCCRCCLSLCLPHSCCPSPLKQTAAFRLKAVALLALVLF